MKYEAITPVQVFLSGKENTIYMLTKVTGTLTLDEIRNATGFVVPIEEKPEPKPWVVEDTAEPTEPIEINTIREGMVETPEIMETPEKAVRRPRGRRPRVPKAVIG